MWQQKKLSGLGLALILLGCSPTPDTIAEQPAAETHLPSVISQLMRPKLDIAALSPDLVNRTVRVEGTVRQQVPLLEGGLYQVEDATGSVWVYSLAALPDVDTDISVEGRLQYEQIVVGETDIGEYYLQEQSRSQPKNRGVTH